jgi:hypothetical protein
MKKFIVFTLFSLLLSTASFAQRNVKDSIIGTPWIAVNYGANWTHKDLALKFGFLNHLGIMAGYKTSKNWFYGIDANFIFGNQVHLNNMFHSLLDSKGNITDINGDIAKVVVTARGLNTNLTIGKIIPILSPNSNSGIFIHGGAGFLAHKYRIDTQDQVIPQIELNYRKGYDRLSMGINFHQFIGYAFMANHGLINFYGGFYAQQGLTHNMRTVFFDQPDIPVSTKTMLDVQVGAKLGWFIPFYKRKPKDFYID